MLLIYADSSSLNLITLARLSPSRLVCSNESNPSTRYWIFDSVKRLSACPWFSSSSSSLDSLYITYVSTTLLLSLAVQIFLIGGLKDSVLLLYLFFALYKIKLYFRFSLPFDS